MKKKVLYVCHTSGSMGGAAHSLFYMVESLKDEITPVILLPAYGKTYNYFTQHGYECYVSPFTSAVRDNRLWRYVLFFLPILIQRYIINRRCVEKVAKRYPDIDIVHSNTSVITIGYKIAQKIGAKHVWHVREMMGNHYHLHPYFGWDDLIMKMKISNAVIGISNVILDYKNLRSLPNIHLVYNAVRHIDDITNKQPKEKYFLFCSGSLSDEKGANEAMEAFCLSTLSELGYHLKFIGNYTSEYRDKLERICAKYHIDCKNVEFLGECDNVSNYFQYACGFLMCSRYEALGRVTIEAMFYGCPVIAVNEGGSRDFVKNRINGLLYDTIKDCADAMVELTKIDTSKFIREGHKTAEELFSVEKYGSKIMQIYNSI